MQISSWLNLNKNTFIRHYKMMSLWYVFINIDDVFMVWTKSEKQLKDFMSDLNQKHASVKFDYKFDYKQIEFLDTLIDVDQQNKLQTTLF